MISFSAHCGTNAVPPSERAVAARRSSMAAVPASASRIRSRASGGSTSVRNPSRPTFTPRTGQSSSAATCAPRRNVPSPPTVTIRSGRAVSSASRAPDDLDAVVPQGGAERRRRVDGGAATLVHDESDDAHPDSPSPSAIAASRSIGCIIHPAAAVEQELDVAGRTAER